MNLWTHLEKLLAGLLASGLPKTVHLVHEEGAIPGLTGGSQMAVPRLSICLKGSATYKLLQDRRPVIVTLRPRELIYVLPQRFVYPQAESRCETLGVVFHPGFTRFLHLRRMGATRAPRQTAYHAPGVLSMDGRFICYGMAEHPAAPPDDRYLRLKMELLLRNALLALRSHAAPAQGKAHLAWEAARLFVQEHCHEPIGRDEVAASVDVHPNHLSRLFAMFSDRTFNGFLRQARLSKSQQLLRDPKLTVEQIARLCGFESGNYYIRQYRKRYGITPNRARAALDRRAVAARQV